jgi:threonylcarbamoyladenosine tRNA methylthiotransferase MtaB
MGLFYGTGELGRLRLWAGEQAAGCYAGVVAGFHVENFGCRAARADGESVSARLREMGLAESALAEADVVVVNTCSVTEEADRDARVFLRKAKRLNPDARVVVTGCYAQRVPEEVAALPGVSAVVGNSHKGLLPEILRQLLPESHAGQEPGMVPAEGGLVPTSQLAATAIWADDAFAHSALEEAQVLPGLQTRPNLKIQEGCSNRCTFCVIPATRGNSRSLAGEKVLKQVEGFVAAGGRELVLSGINLGRWGRDLPGGVDGPATLAGLVRQILESTELARLRLSSIEPMDWTAELVGLLKEFGGSARLARHAHLPLQSGSDGVLRRMHRRYRPWHYAEKVAHLVDAAGPALCVGADVMVGFPGETEEEFRETFDFVAGLPFAYLHLFPFSPRPGTPGWQMHQEAPVSPTAQRERMRALEALAREKSQAFRAAQLGEALPAITLHASPKQVAVGAGAALTDNFLPVTLLEPAAANQCGRVMLQAVQGDGSLVGRFVADAV